MDEAINILVVDDDKNMRESLALILNDQGYSVYQADSFYTAEQLFSEHAIHLIITDVRMPDADGFVLLEQMKRKREDIPIIMITAYSSPSLALKAVNMGAYDYLSKPFDPDEMLQLIAKVLKRTQRFQGEINDKPPIVMVKVHDDERVFIGSSKKMIEIQELIYAVAPTATTVLIEGESGTGKELVARAVHCYSKRAAAPFIAINCAALPENLLESELFGHEKGAFTDAIKQQKGKFEEADGGTIFLDEIGDMSLDLQGKILRVLQERTFSRVGGNHLIYSDVRVIAATNKDLSELIQINRFREDLYYRLNVFKIVLPPLRDRSEDIEVLVDYFIKKYSGGRPNVSVDKTVLDIFKAYEWPGNIRELENTIERSLILNHRERLTVSSLPEQLKHYFDDQQTRVSPGSPRQDPLVLPPLLLSKNTEKTSADEIINFGQLVYAYEKNLIEDAIRKKGTIVKAAHYLSLSRFALKRKMDKLGIRML